MRSGRVRTARKYCVHFMAGNGFVACVAQTKTPAPDLQGRGCERMTRLFALTAEEEQRQAAQSHQCHRGRFRNRQQIDYPRGARWIVDGSSSRDRSIANHSRSTSRRRSRIDPTKGGYAKVGWPRYGGTQGGPICQNIRHSHPTCAQIDRPANHFNIVGGAIGPPTSSRRRAIQPRSHLNAG